MVKQGASEGGNTNNSCFLKLHKEQMLSVLQPPIPGSNSSLKLPRAWLPRLSAQQTVIVPLNIKGPSAVSNKTPCCNTYSVMWNVHPHAQNLTCTFRLEHVSKAIGGSGLDGISPTLHVCRNPFLTDATYHIHIS